jgi:pimeloyl-ACP methyl ester carboxylesterase
VLLNTNHVYLPLISPHHLAHLLLEIQGGWRNQARAAFGLEASSYRPIESVPHVTAPVLYITAVKDTLCPQEAIQAAVASTPRARQIVMPCTHFDVYRGKEFEQVVEAETAFLLEHLAPEAAAATAAAAAAAAEQDSAAAEQGAAVAGGGDAHEEL